MTKFNILRKFLRTEDGNSTVEMTLWLPFMLAFDAAKLGFLLALLLDEGLGVHALKVE